MCCLIRRDVLCRGRLVTQFLTLAGLNGLALMVKLARSWVVAPVASCCPRTIGLRKRQLRGAIGEASNLFLIPDGAYLHPVYNDVNGSTDKFLTASAKIGAGQTYESMGWESVYYWRMSRPISTAIPSVRRILIFCTIITSFDGRFRWRFAKSDLTQHSSGQTDHNSNQPPGAGCFSCPLAAACQPAGRI